MDNARNWEEQERMRIGKELQDWCYTQVPRMTREKLGDKLGLHYQTVSRIWHGERKLKDNEISVLSKLMDKDSSFFIVRPPTDERFPHGVCQSGQMPANSVSKSEVKNKRAGPPSNTDEENALRKKLIKMSIELKSNIESIESMEAMKILYPILEGLVIASR